MNDPLRQVALRTAYDNSQRTASILRQALITPQFESDTPLPHLILACAQDNFRRAAPAEYRASQRIAEKLGREPRPGCFFYPVEAQRDLIAGTGSAGGFLKGLAVSPGGYFGQSMADVSLADQLGVAQVPCVNDASFARVVTPFTAGWLSDEGTAASESTPVLAAAAASPKTVAGYFEISRQLLQQATQDANNFVLSELARAVQGAANAGLVNGSGASGQPTGIIGTSGVGSQSGTSLAWAGVIEMMRLVEANGPFAPSRAAWVAGTATAKLLRTRERATGAGLILDDGSIGGYPAYVTTAMPSDALLFGDWSGVVMPTWGILEIGADPYQADSGTGFRKGIVGVRCFWSIDVAVLRPASFAKSTSVT